MQRGENMAVQQVSAEGGQVRSLADADVSTSSVGVSGVRGSFQAILLGLERWSSASSSIGEANRLRAALDRGQSLSPRELIALQIHAGEVGIRVELVSRVVESALGAVRRLQSPQ
jgi:hypothetical protein